MKPIFSHLKMNMNLTELIHSLQKIEEAFWWHIKVHLKYGELTELPIITVVTEKQPNWERIVLLE